MQCQQRSLLVQEAPSLHDAPADRQVPEQTPPWQNSLKMHGFPEGHHHPSGLVGLEQMPVEGLQVPTSWQLSEAVQTTGSEPTQVPPWQVSVRVQALPSSHK